MKRIDTSHITDPNVRLPFAAKSLNWLQTAYKEQFAAIIEGLTNYVANQVIVVSGAVVTYTGPTGGTASVMAGWVYYNGEFYQVKANGSLTIGTGQIPVWTIQTLPDTIAAGGTGNDPTLFSDGTSTFNVHLTDYFILASGPAGGSGVTGYVCDYNSSNVIYYNGYFSDFTLANATTTGGTITSVQFEWQKKGKMVYFNYYVGVNMVSGTNTFGVNINLNALGIPCDGNYPGFAAGIAEKNGYYPWLAVRANANSGTLNLTIADSGAINTIYNIYGQIFYQLA